MNLADLESEAYLLHLYKSGENKATLIFFSKKHGKIRLFSRLHRDTRWALRPFNKLWIQLAVKNKKFYYLNKVESLPQAESALNRNLLACFHLNELLLFHLEEQDVQEELYYRYQALIEGEVKPHQLREMMCRFELYFIETLGYSIPFPDHFIDPKATYFFHPSLGFVQNRTLLNSIQMPRAKSSSKPARPIVLLGEEILKIQSDCLSGHTTQIIVKSLVAQQLTWHASAHYGNVRKLAKLWRELQGKEERTW